MFVLQKYYYDYEYDYRTLRTNTNRHASTIEDSVRNGAVYTWWSLFFSLLSCARECICPGVHMGSDTLLDPSN